MARQTNRQTHEKGSDVYEDKCPAWKRSTYCRLPGSLLHKFSAFTQISLSNAGSRACFSGGRIYNRSSAGGGGGG